jgi:hypothetical protein
LRRTFSNPTSAMSITAFWSALVLGICASAGPTTLPDQSLTTAQYIQRGVPAPDHPWSVADYKGAVKALSAIAKENPAQLPHRRSRTSGEIFAQLISEHAFDELGDQKVSLEKRIRIGADSFYPTTEVMRLYLDASPKTDGFDAEKMALNVQLLRLEQKMLSLGAEFPANLPEHVSPENLRRARENLDSIMAKCAVTADRTLDMVSYPVLDVATREDAIRQLIQILPPLVKLMPEPARVGERIRVLNMIDAERNERVRAALSDLSAELQKDRNRSK